jgi:hypothetical protein
VDFVEDEIVIFPSLLEAESLSENEIQTDAILDTENMPIEVIVEDEMRMLILIILIATNLIYS